MLLINKRGQIPVGELDELIEHLPTVYLLRQIFNSEQCDRPALPLKAYRYAVLLKTSF